MARFRLSIRRIFRPATGRSGASASYQISQIYGGGLIPIVAGLILRTFGIHEAYIYIGLLVMVYAILAIVAIFASPETRDANLEDDAPRRSRLVAEHN